jgi:hypothetical protein
MSAYRRSFTTTLAIVAMTAATGALAQSGYGQVVLDNQMSVTVDLSVDGRYGCRALARLNCTTQEVIGYHVLTATASDGRSTQQIVENLLQGEVYTFRVWEE